MNLLHLILIAIAGFIVLGFLFAKKEEEGYHASFIRIGQALSWFNRGLSLSGSQHKLTELESHRNAAVIGQVGSGKSSSVAIPNLLMKRNASYIVLDLSGELWQFAPVLKGYEHDVYRIHLNKPEQSISWNPLASAKTDTDLQRIASMLVQYSLKGGKGSSGGGQAFWDISAERVLAMLLKLLQKLPEYNNPKNLKYLVTLMASSPKQIDQLFANSDLCDVELFEEYKSIMAMDTKLRSSVLATCQAAVQIFADPAVAKVTGTDQAFDWSVFRKGERPVTLFLTVNPADRDRLAGLLSMLFHECYSWYLDNMMTKREDRSLYMILDEYFALPVIPSFLSSLTLLRKAKVGQILFAQSLEMFKRYGQSEARTILENCYSKVFVGPQGENAAYLEQVLGKRDIVDEEGRLKRVLPLLQAQQARELDSNTGIILINGKPPIKARMKPWFKNWSMKVKVNSADEEVRFPTAAEQEVSLLPISELIHYDVA